MGLIAVFYVKVIALMTLMVTHILLFLKGHCNPSWMFKGHTILRPTIYKPQVNVMRQGQREDTLIQDWLENKLIQLLWECISKILQISHIVTQKFQLGRHTVRKIMKIEENKIMCKENH